MGKGIFKVLGSVLIGVFLTFLIVGCNGSNGSNGGGGTGSQTQTPLGVLQGDTTATTPPAVSTVTNPNPNSFQPRGSIQGVVRDAVTGFAIVGARVTLSIPGAGETTVTTGSSGQYSFTNVPGSLWGDGSGGNAADGVVQFGELSAYTITVDLAGVNAGLPAGTALYPGQAFADAVVGFASFQDGNNALLCQAAGANLAPGGAGGASGGAGGAGAAPGGAGGAGGAGGTGGTGGSGPSLTCTEAGSGASTPVDGLVTSLNFIIGRLTETIRGAVRDAQNGKLIAGATVTLLDAAVPLPGAAGGVTPAPFPAAGPLGNGIRLSLTNPSVTTAADGTFTFGSVPASHTFRVTASVPNFPPPIGYVPTTTAIFGTQGGGITVVVPATPANSNNNSGLPLLGTAGTGEILLAQGIPGVDSVPPYVISSSPADGADIDVTAAGNPKRPIVLCFSEIMQTDLVFTKATVATVDFKGIPIPVDAGRVSVADALIEVTQAWSTGGTACPGGGSVLTITPVNNFQAGLVYGVFLGGTPAPLPGAAPLADLAGNPCCRCISLNALGTSITAGVCGGGVAGVANSGAVLGEAAPTPAVLLFSTNGGPAVLDGPAASLGANSADWSTSTATISWTAVPNARAYEVYMSVGSNEFQLIARTLPNTSPVTSMISRSWSFNDALNFPPCSSTAGPGTLANLPCTAGINPSAPTQSVANPNPRIAPGFEVILNAAGTAVGAGRRILEGSIPDVSDDVSTLPPTAAPVGITGAVGVAAGTVAVDSADGLADMSDNFGAASQVRIAIAAVNSNGVVGSLGTPVVLKDNTGPSTNGVSTIATAITTFPNPGVPSTVAGAAIASTIGQGQVLQDRLDPNDVDGDGNKIEPDGVPDTIVLGFSEPLAIATVSCSSVASCNAIYKLRAADGTIPARLAAINVSVATYDEDANGNGVLDPGEDADGNGLLTRGSNLDVTSADTIKGNNFGTTFVTLRIDPATAGGAVDIRPGDYVDYAATITDLAGNAARPVDPTLPQNQLGDLTPPSVLAVAQAAIVNNGPGVRDTVTLTFSEALGAFPLAGLTFRVAGVNCNAGGVTSINPPFRAGSSSVTLSIDSSLNAACDVGRLFGDGATALSDIIAFAATITDQGGNAITTKADTLLFNGTGGTGSFVVASSATGIPADVTRPTLLAVAFGNLSAAGPPAEFDRLTLTFSERLGAFSTAAAQFFFTVGGVNCTSTVLVDQNPAAADSILATNTRVIQPFIPGDTVVNLIINSGLQGTAVIAGCDLTNLANADVIALTAPGVDADISTLTLNPQVDTAVFNNGGYAITSQP